MTVWYLSGNERVGDVDLKLAPKIGLCRSYGRNLRIVVFLEEERREGSTGPYIEIRSLLTFKDQREE